MFGDRSTLTSRIILLLGPVYLLYMAMQPPPERWVGIACLVILTPFVVGWALGRFAGIGPWAA